MCIRDRPDGQICHSIYCACKGSFAARCNKNLQPVISSIYHHPCTVLQHKLLLTKWSKLVPYSITECWTCSWCRSLGSQHAGDLVLNVVVDYHYFPPSLKLLSQPKIITAPWPLPNYTTFWQRQSSLSSLPRIGTRNMWIASLTPYQLCHHINVTINCNFNINYVVSKYCGL